MKYVNYDKDTGQILGYYDKEIHGKYVEPEYDNNGKIIKEGYWDLSNIPEPYIEITDEQWQEALQNNYNYIDIENKTLGKKDFRNLDAIKKAKKLKIENAYNQAIQQPIVYNIDEADYVFQANKHSQDILNKVIVSAPDNFEIDWLDIDNNFAHMTLAQLKGLAEAILQRGQQLFMKKIKLKKQVDETTTKDKVKEVQW